MHVRITHQPALRLVGHTTQVPLIHEGINPQIQAHVAAIPHAEHLRLKRLGNAPPDGLLQISLELDPKGAEGSELTYMHGVATTDDTPTPDDLQSIGVPTGSWAVFTTEGPHPEALQETWAATATEWFPTSAWRLRPGPSIVSVRAHNEDFTTATCDLWLPVEPA